MYSIPPVRVSAKDPNLVLGKHRSASGIETLGGSLLLLGGSKQSRPVLRVAVARVQIACGTTGEEEKGESNGVREGHEVLTGEIAWMNVPGGASSGLDGRPVNRLSDRLTGDVFRRASTPLFLGL
jgi:hypothetical protein